MVAALMAVCLAGFKEPAKAGVGSVTVTLTPVGPASLPQGYAFTKAVKGFQNLPGALTFLSGTTLDQVELSSSA